MEEAGAQELFARAVQRFEKEDVNGAEDLLKTLIDHTPDHAEAYHLLGLIVLKRGDRRCAGAFFKKAASCAPEQAKYHYNYGTVLQNMGEIRPAISAYESALAVEPDHAETHNNLGAALRDIFQLSRSEKHIRTALELQPENVSARNNLASVLRDQGRIGTALATYRETLARDPHNHITHSNLLLCMHYMPDYDVQEVFGEHKRWATLHGSQFFRMNHTPDKYTSGKRPLFIGFVSADFDTHSVAFFLKPLLHHLNRSEFTVFCYNAGSKEDNTTRWFKQLPVVWRDIFDLSDAAAAARIRQDGIDILVDCSGHTDGHRLKVFAMKPAPIQVTYLGYPDTTGLSEMDFRFTDPWADPLDDSTPSSETLFHLPNGFLCYRPPEGTPPVNSLPAINNGYITFGSFNDIPKLNRHVLELWSKLLLEVPSAVLLLKTRQFNDMDVAVQFRNFFVNRGISINRIRIIGEVTGILNHLRWYHHVDVALDPYPYNGTTATYEALIMGVPVITCKGRVHAGRVGHSIMSRMGLSEFVVSSPKKYIALAAYLSRNLDLLSRLRPSLRDTVMARNDGAVFTKQVENAFQQMWERWCSK